VQRPGSIPTGGQHEAAVHYPQAAAARVCYLLSHTPAAPACGLDTAHGLHDLFAALAQPRQAPE